MTPTTLVMAYYENPKMLRRQFANLRSLPDDLRNKLQIIIVDDGSPKFPAKPEQLNGILLQMYRMQKDIRWNQDACRNIGMRHVETEWALMTDMDHIVPEQTWRKVLLGDWDNQMAYHFSRLVETSDRRLVPYKMHYNSWLMTRKKFYEAGGYDERFAGLYQDNDLVPRLKKVAKIGNIGSPIICVSSAVVSDANTRTYQRTYEKDLIEVNRIKQERGDQKPLRYQFAYDRVC